MMRFWDRAFSSLKIRNYRLYVIGQGISLCGTWMQIIGQDWLILKLTGSGTQLGVVSAFQFLPTLLLGPLGGVLADRFSKRRILYFTQSAFAVLALLLGILVAAGSVRIWMVYIFATCLGLLNVIDSPTRQTFIPEMVGNDQLGNAVTLNGTEFNLARAIGPVIAGAIIAGLGLAFCFLINAVSYVAVLVMLAKIRAKELHPTARAKRAKGQLREGLRYIRSSPTLRSILLMMAIIGTFTYEFSVTLPLLAQITFHGDAATYGALTASFGFGSVLGGLWVAGYRKASGSMLVSWTLCLGAGLIIVAFMPTLITACIFMAAVGVASLGFASLGATTLQLETPPEMRGRVMSLWTVAVIGSTPIGGPIIGFVSEHFGPRFGLGIGGLAAILAAGLGALTFLKKDRLRRVSPQVEMVAEQAVAGEEMKLR